MISWIKVLTNSIAFRLAWSKQKSVDKEARWSELLLQFPAESIEKDAAIRESQITKEVQLRYGSKAKEYEHQIRVVNNRLSKLTKVEAVLTRNFEQELLSCYERKEQIKRMHETIKIDISDAYRRLKSAKSDINTWHRISRSSSKFFGNAGKTLPKHSFWGQSFGDLDAAKARRDMASGDVRNLKNERVSLSNEFEQLDTKILKIREGQREHRELLSQGYTISSVVIEKGNLTKRFKQLSLRKAASKRRETKVLDKELKRNSVPEDRQRAESMRSERKKELKKFMADEQLAIRRDAFFIKWRSTRAT